MAVCRDSVLVCSALFCTHGCSLDLRRSTEWWLLHESFMGPMLFSTAGRKWNANKPTVLAHMSTAVHFCRSCAHESICTQRTWKARWIAVQLWKCKIMRETRARFTNRAWAWIWWWLVVVSTSSQKPACFSVALYDPIAIRSQLLIKPWQQTLQWALQVSKAR